jgi:hypothetical protein
MVFESSRALTPNDPRTGQLWQGHESGKGSMQLAQEEGFTDTVVDSITVMAATRDNLERVVMSTVAFREQRAKRRIRWYDETAKHPMLRPERFPSDDQPELELGGLMVDAMREAFAAPTLIELSRTAWSAQLGRPELGPEMERIQCDAAVTKMLLAQNWSVALEMGEPGSERRTYLTDSLTRLDDVELIDLSGEPDA